MTEAFMPPRPFPTQPGDPDPWDGGDYESGVEPGGGWVSDKSAGFNDQVQALYAALKEAHAALEGGAGDPEALATYQAALSEYNMFRMAQSNTAKNLSDMQKGTLRNLV